MPQRPRPRVNGTARLASVLMLLALATLVASPVAAADRGRLDHAAVLPAEGTTATPFTFTVRYRDGAGIPADVRVNVAGAWRAMTPTSTTWGSGVVFTLTTTLPAGSSPVTFEARNVGGMVDVAAGPTVVVTPAAVPTSPPTPPPTPEPTPHPTPTREPIPTATPIPPRSPIPTPTPGTTHAPVPTATSTTPGDDPGAPSSRTPEPARAPGLGAGDAPSQGPDAGDEGTPSDDHAGTSPATAGPPSGQPGRPSAEPSAPGAAGGPAASVGGAGSGGHSDPGAPGAAGDSGAAAGTPGAGTVQQSGGAGTATLDLPLGALAALGVWGGPRIDLTLTQAFVVSTGAATMAMAFMFFGKRRRDGEPPAPDDDLAAAAASAPADPADAALATPPHQPVDPDLLMPRWRRPSLLQARKSDPMREAAPVVPLTFDDAGSVADDAERRLIRYHVVELLDAPDELQSRPVGSLIHGDEVQLLEPSGTYWRVLCPNGQEGWIHRTTLGEVVGTTPAPTRVDTWEIPPELLARLEPPRAPDPEPEPALFSAVLAARRADA